MTETPATYRDSSGNPFSQNPSEVERATKLVVEALGGFYWRGDCDYIKFCEVVGFEPSKEAEEKYSQLQALINNLNKFDLQSITKLVQKGVDSGKK
jgi:hypothetical protein